MANITRGPLPQDNFTQISNDWLRDKRLSWKARGLLAWLTSHNSGFEVSLSRIVGASDRDGRESARAAIKELETCGYLLRAKDRDEAGRITSASYTLVDACPDCDEDPNAQVTPIVGFSDVGKTDVGPADVGPADVGSTDGSETRTYKKNISSKKTNTKNTTTPVAPEPGGQLEVAGGSVAVADAPARRRKRTAIDPAFKPPVEEADKMAAELGVTRAVLGALLPEFIDFWRSDGRMKADWIATWRNSMRYKAENGRLRPGADGGRSNDPAMDVLRAELANHRESTGSGFLGVAR